jgi:hypothetical protein
MSKASPVLMFGNEPVVMSPRVDPERQLTALAELFAEVAEVGVVLRGLEERMKAQDVWLDANRRHPLWVERSDTARLVRGEHERTMVRVHEIAHDANRLIEKMDNETVKEARDCVHAWAAIGGVAIYAVAWDVVPSTTWLEMAMLDGEAWQEIVCPF